MPQDGSNNYQYPPGTPGVPNQTIESEAYNTFLDDLVVNDLNWPRPVHRGGTGATTAAGARDNLDTEVAGALVTNYDSHVWEAGSFSSAVGATAAPTSTEKYQGIAAVIDAANVTIEAWTFGATPDKKYARQKVAGVWSAWADMDARYVNVTGDTMTGDLLLANDPTLLMHAATKQYVDSHLIVKTQAYVVSGTYTPSANLICVMVEVIGGGGGGGGVNGAVGYTLGGGGGGAGGYTRGMFLAASIGASKPFAVGAGGTWGAAGGQSSFMGMVVHGGSPGTATGVGSIGSGGLGGLALVPGSFGIDGEKGFSGFYVAAAAPLTISGGGEGASSTFGGGGKNGPANNSSVNGGNATGVGAGGAGGSCHNVSATTQGGAGSSGLITFTEYCQR